VTGRRNPDRRDDGAGAAGRARDVLEDTSGSAGSVQEPGA
jgi:hypothetical protein